MMRVLLRAGRAVEADRVTVTHGGVLELRRSFGAQPFMLIAADRWESVEQLAERRHEGSPDA